MRWENLNIFSAFDAFIVPMFFLIILGLAYANKQRKIKTNPAYKYYIPGLVVKMLAAVIFCFIYTFYYGYGDTVDYFVGGRSMGNLMVADFDHYMQIMLTQKQPWYYYGYFTNETGFAPYFMWKDPHTFFVIKCVSLIVNIAFKSFLATAILLAALSYVGVWKLYLFFTHYYPKMTKELAIAVLFIPSVIFWGSGIMKDTFTFASSCWFIYSVFKIFVKKEQIPLHIFTTLITAFIILSIKPYIFVALMPGTLIWVFYQRMRKIKSQFFKILLFPIIIIVLFGINTLLFSGIKDYLGEFGSYDNIVKRAQIIKDDLTREEQYGKNYYDVGTIGGGAGDMISSVPKALMAGLFRPFLWEAASPVMMMSGLENTILLLLTIYLIIKIGFIKFFTQIFADPVLVFSFTFMLFFLFGVGLATANFGALVRYKIPAMPFFAATLLILYGKMKEKQKDEEAERLAKRKERQQPLYPQ